MALISPRTILLIEDHTACLEAWEVMLEDLWPEVRCLGAPTLADGIHAIETLTQIDMVCADLHLPDSTPKETLATLVHVLPPDIPLVLISGSVLPLEGYDMLRLGADTFCPKGMDTSHMQNRIYMAWAAACGRRVRQQAWTIV